MDVERIHIAVCGGKSGRRFVVKNGLGELALDYKLTVAVDGEDTELHSRNGCWRHGSVMGSVGPSSPLGSRRTGSERAA